MLRAVDQRVVIGGTPEEKAEDDAFLALYGEWAPMTPPELAEEMRQFNRPWWIVGGWAIEAATGFQREHEDTDMSILACDVPAFVDFMRGRWHVWNNVGGVLHPLGDRWPDVDEPRSQLWLRASAKDPWIVDIPLTPDADGLWTNKLLEQHVAPVDDVTWLAEDGIRYLLPEIVLLYKARLHRTKDEPDFIAALPRLTRGRREWLREALTAVVPGHPWIRKLT